MAAKTGHLLRRGGGGATKMVGGGGALSSEVLPLQKREGSDKVLTMLKGVRE